MKKCSRCKEVKPFEEFYSDRSRKDGYQKLCILCVKEYSQTEKRKASNKKYKQSEKGKLANKRKHHKRRTTMKDAGTFTNEQWKGRLLEYNYCCAYCYKPFTKEELEIDHMIPVSLGGTNTIDNLVPACKSCNRRKNNKTPLVMLQKGLM